MKNGKLEMRLVGRWERKYFRHSQANDLGNPDYIGEQGIHLLFTSHATRHMSRAF